MIELHRVKIFNLLIALKFIIFRKKYIMNLSNIMSRKYFTILLFKNKKNKINIELESN